MTGADEGRSLYLHGEITTPATALTGADDTEVPTTLMPCASCHGAEGRGRAEGGVQPLSIEPAVLRASRAGERARPAYDDAKLTRAIAMGIDAAGNRLDTTMPRYRLSAADMRALIGYLGTLGNTPGVDAQTIRIDILGSRSEQLAKQLTRAGEIFGRRIEARSVDTVRDDTFAVIATVPLDDATAAAAESRAIPLITPFRTSLKIDRHVFAICTNVEQQSEALRAKFGESRKRLVPAALAKPDMFDGDGQPKPDVVIAYPFLGRAESLELAQTEVLVEALRRAGRDLTREKLIEALKSFYEFPTSAAPVTFSPRRHVGIEPVIVQRNPG